MLKLNVHIKVQLNKAKASFQSNKNIFYNKYLDPKAKIICYTLLVRPVIMYAFPIWFNLSASMMERIRIFERSCLRACLGKYRSETSEYKRYISNAELYRIANIPRTDNFGLKLCRKYHAKLPKIENNRYIQQFTQYTDE